MLSSLLMAVAFCSVYAPIMSACLTHLRLASSRSDGTVDLLCADDVRIPAHAEIALFLLSLTCSPEDRMSLHSSTVLYCR